MKRYLQTILLMSAVLMLPLTSLAQFAGGNGTVNEPWQVATVEQLQAVNNVDYFGNHFIQINDIDASETVNWNDGKGFEPIAGEGGHFFWGTYDGNGYEIRNLTITRPDDDNVGLFATLGQSSVHGTFIDLGGIWRLTLENVAITGRNEVGGLVGHISYGNVYDAHVSGTIAGQNNVGGIAGGLSGFTGLSNINRSSVRDINVVGDMSVGGLFGSGWGRISESSAEGEVSGNHTVGGLVGFFACALGEEQIFSSYANVTVTGGKSIGGLVGHLESIGLVGKTIGQSAENLSTINAEPESCGVMQVYSVGTVAGQDSIGGLIGLVVDTPALEGYWDIQKSEQNNGIGHLVYPDDTTIAISGLTTDQFSGQNAPNSLGKFNFDTIWQATEGYPELILADAPLMAVNHSTNDYADVETGTSESGSFFLENRGDDTLSGTVELSGRNASSFQITDGVGTFSLEPGEFKIIEVIFEPEIEGVNWASLKLDHNALNWNSPVRITLRGSGVKSSSIDDEDDIPTVVELHQNYPNPFNPTTQIRFELPMESQVELGVYTVTGRLIETLVNEVRPAGTHDVSFDATDLASGVYIYRIRAGDFTQTRKMTLIK